MALKDRIAKLGRYFESVEIKNIDNETYIVVTINFPSNWMVDVEKIEEKFSVTVQNPRPSLFYFITAIENGEDSIFDAIDSSILTMEETLERARLLLEKTQELKTIFEDEKIPLSELKTLTFTYRNTALQDLYTPKSGKKTEIKNLISDTTNNKKSENKD